MSCSRLDSDDMEWDDDDNLDGIDDSQVALYATAVIINGHTYAVEFTADTFHDVMLRLFNWGQDPEIPLTSRDAAKLCQAMKAAMGLEVVG